MSLNRKPHPDGKIGDRYIRQVADTFLQQMQSGILPWQQPWEYGNSGSAARNAVTGRPYGGGNQMNLTMRQFALPSVNGRIDPRWCTFKQAQAAGWRVKAGSKATIVRFWKTKDRVPAKNPDGSPVLGPDGKRTYDTIPLEYPRVFHASVFHASQIAGIPNLPKEHEKVAWDPLERAEAIIKRSGADVSHGGDRAYYNPLQDRIVMPDPEQFKSSGAYYRVLMHELAHWTGHKSRLNRDDIMDRKSNATYAQEELRAEIASYMLCVDLGLGHSPEDHAAQHEGSYAYVAHWCAATLRDAPEAIYEATRDAAKIMHMVRGFDLEPEPEPTAESEAAAEDEAGPSGP